MLRVGRPVRIRMPRSRRTRHFHVFFTSAAKARASRWCVQFSYRVFDELGCFESATQADAFERQVRREEVAC
jgi:hypothetical protein